MGITNGFASQSPFPTGAYSPPGLTALSKHPYAGAKLLPPNSMPPTDACLTTRWRARHRRGTQLPKRSRFVPHLQELFPEVSLTASSGSAIVRDIAPITTTVYGAPHGPAAARQRPPQLW